MSPVRLPAFLSAKRERHRLLYAVLVAVVIVLGLLSRGLHGLPPFLHAYAGDTLWAMTVFAGTAFVLRTRSTLFVTVCALLFCFGIEISQLYHAPWIDAIRAVRLGGLVLGYGFLWSDLLCYTAGCMAGAALDCLLNIRKIRRHS